MNDENELKEVAEGDELADESTNDGLLAAQSFALKRLIKTTGISVTDLGKEIGVQKQNLHIWMRGQAIIPEASVQKLAQFFKVHPAEIRYDVPAFNEEDLKSVVVLLELFLKSQGKELDPVRKSKAIAVLYNNKQHYRRMALKDFSEKEFSSMANGILEGFIL